MERKGLAGGGGGGEAGAGGRRRGEERGARLLELHQLPVRTQLDRRRTLQARALEKALRE